MPRLKFNEEKVQAVKCEVCGTLHDINSKTYIKIAGWIGVGNYANDTSKGVPIRYVCVEDRCYAQAINKFNVTESVKAPRKRTKKAECTGNSCTLNLDETTVTQE